MVNWKWGNIEQTLVVTHEIMLRRYIIMSKRKKDFYAVKKGRMIGIFDNWGDCQKAVVGFSVRNTRDFLTNMMLEHIWKEGNQI